jgi:hypothetical protein
MRATLNDAITLTANDSFNSPELKIPAILFASEVLLLCFEELLQVLALLVALVRVTMMTFVVVLVIAVG